MPSHRWRCPQITSPKHRKYFYGFLIFSFGHFARAAASTRWHIEFFILRFVVRNSIYGIRRCSLAAAPFDFSTYSFVVLFCLSLFRSRIPSTRICSACARSIHIFSSHKLGFSFCKHLHLAFSLAAAGIPLDLCDFGQSQNCIVPSSASCRIYVGLCQRSCENRMNWAPTQTVSDRVPYLGWIPKRKRISIFGNVRLVSMAVPMPHPIRFSAFFSPLDQVSDHGVCNKIDWFIEPRGGRLRVNYCNGTFWMQPAMEI